jgi:hypothetical protein
MDIERVCLLYGDCPNEGHQVFFVADIGSYVGYG